MRSDGQAGRQAETRARNPTEPIRPQMIPTQPAAPSFGLLPLFTIQTQQGKRPARTAHRVVCTSTFLKHRSLHAAPLIRGVIAERYRRQNALRLLRPRAQKTPRSCPQSQSANAETSHRLTQAETNLLTPEHYAAERENAVFGFAIGEVRMGRMTEGRADGRTHLFPLATGREESGCCRLGVWRGHGQVEW